MERLFDKKKKYFLTIQREGQNLFFNATEVEVIGELITFKDRFNKQMIFPLDSLMQAQEEKKLKELE